MLTLTRAPGEAIVIGEDIVVTVLEISGDRVRVGVEAPDDVPIARVENRPGGGASVAVAGGPTGGNGRRPAIFAEAACEVGEIDEEVA